jgi:hypothetical protein
VAKITPKEKGGRFPDYEVTTPVGSLIVEIKEFTPNDEDNAFATEMDTTGTASFSSRSIGKRIRKAIIDAAPQLRRYKNTLLPEVLLLYDNMASDSYGGINDYLDPMNVGAGMFGQPVIRFWRDPSLKPPGAQDATHGGGRQFTETTRLYIAIGRVHATTRVSVSAASTSHHRFWYFSGYRFSFRLAECRPCKWSAVLDTPFSMRPLQTHSAGGDLSQM